VAQSHEWSWVQLFCWVQPLLSSASSGARSRTPGYKVSAFHFAAGNNNHEACWCSSTGNSCRVASLWPEAGGEAKTVVRSSLRDGVQRAGEPHLCEGGAEVALGSHARLPLVTRLKMHVWFSRADLSLAAEMVSRASPCGASKARVFSSSWASLVSGGRRLVEEEKGLSKRLSKRLSMPGKRRGGEELGEALGLSPACKL
jgi:hypothetical protein